MTSEQKASKIQKYILRGQQDLGVMQLETAAEAIPTMTELKMKVIYELAACAKAAGDNEKAYNYYKDIYSNDVTFMDVEAKMIELKKGYNDMKEEMLALVQILFTCFNAAIVLLVINCAIAPICGLSIKVTYEQAIMYCMLSKLAHMAVKQHDMF